MGVDWTRYPAITIVTPKGNYFPIPETVNFGDRNFAQKYLEEHMLNFTKGLLAPPQLSPVDQDLIARRDSEILERLTNTRNLNSKNFKDSALSQDLDVVVFVYTSDKNHESFKRCLNWAFDYDTVSMKFRNMKIKSVFLIAYDIFTEGMSPDIDDSTVPSIYLYPAKKRSFEERSRLHPKNANKID